MKQETRNKLALVLFCLLFSLGGGLLLLYVFIGHGWNFAATEIDEVSGSMEEYLVIMFDGTTDPMLVASQKASDEDLPGFGQGDITLGDEDADAVLNAMLDEKYGPVEVPVVAEEEAVESEEEEEAVEPDEVVAEEPVKEEETAQRGPLSIAEAVASVATNGIASKEDDTANKDLGSAYASYLGKNAEVMPLYTKDPDVFSDGTIYVKGTYRVGILGMTKPIATDELQARIDKLYDEGANFVVFIGPYAEIISGAHGIDVMIVTQGSSALIEGHWKDGVYVVQSPVVTTIGAVIVSPNHVMSVKRITTF